MSIAALIVAAGQGTRFGGESPKQFAFIGDKPILLHSIELFQNMREFDSIWIVIPEETAKGFHRRFDLKPYSKIAGVVTGGGRRQDSVWLGLTAITAQTDILAIHDAVRPFAAPEAITEAIKRALRMGAAILASPAVDTPKMCDEEGRVTQTLDRRQVWLAQTPQVFRFDLIQRAYEHVIKENLEVTDDAAAVECLGEPVEVVHSPRPNPKITTPEDLRFAEWLLADLRR
jgi:2-C-methyl-D-erythritol 4-phosphate cytidylyltransferase